MAKSQRVRSHSKSSSVSSSNNGKKEPKGTNYYHHGSKLRKLKMQSGGKPVRDARGKIIQAAEFASSVPDTVSSRIQPDRRWFGNTRVISQDTLDKFRAEISVKRSDPYSVLLKQSKLPMSLLGDSKIHVNRTNILDVESFSHTFGLKAQRKRPRLNISSLNDLVCESTTKSESFLEHKDAREKDTLEFEDSKNEVSRPIFQKGQSRRIWNELFKVIDSSDVLVHVLDARDPVGTKCRAIEDYITKEAPHKHLVYLINKADLVPSNICEQWVRIFAKERPTIVFRASLKNPFGRNALFALLRQFSKLHSDKKQISVGFVGYPNTGKSSIINALRQKSVCSVAPIPGQTKVWQYVSLTKKIYLIDCPGVVPAGAYEGSETEKILRGVVRIEHVEYPEEHVPAILRVVRPEYISKTYGGIEVVSVTPMDINRHDPITSEEESNAHDFLRKMANNYGRLLKGGEPDFRTAAIIVINDLIRGRIPYFVMPPKNE